MDKKLEEVEKKASILIDALPYIRDFSQKIIVVEYGCSEWLSGMEEQQLMQDIVLLKSVGMYPIVVHDTRMGMDKFRENKRIAKLLELCSVKAIGVCGIDEQTIHMMLENDYIPVIVPNDIDNESEYIDPKETALEIAVRLGADKLVYLSTYPGIFTDENTKQDVYPRLTAWAVEALEKERDFPEDLKKMLDYALQATGQGVNRVHLLDGRIRHVLLLELFSVVGAGTIIIKDENKLYEHEVKDRNIIEYTGNKS